MGGKDGAKGQSQWQSKYTEGRMAIRLRVIHSIPCRVFTRQKPDCLPPLAINEARESHHSPVAHVSMPDRALIPPVARTLLPIPHPLDLL